MEGFEGTQREYVAPDVGCATGGGYAAGYAGQQCTTTCAPTGGIATGAVCDECGGRGGPDQQGIPAHGAYCSGIFFIGNYR